MAGTVIITASGAHRSNARRDTGNGDRVCRPSPRADCRNADFSAFIGFAGIFPALPPRSGAAAVQDTDVQSIRRYCISQIVSAIINPSRRWMTVRRPHRLQAQKKYRSQAQAGEKGIGSRKGESMAYSLFLLVSTGFSDRAGSSPGRLLRRSLLPHLPSLCLLRPGEINSFSFHYRVLLRGCAAAAGCLFA